MPSYSLEDVEDSLTVAQAAAIVHREPKTVRAWIASGELPAVRLDNNPRGRLLITRRALIEYVNRRARAQGAAS